jgi:hypothetical protein
MKKVVLLFVFALTLQLGHASLAISFPVDTVQSQVNSSSKLTEKDLLKKISKMSVKEYEAYTHKKMNLFERMSFKAYKKKLKIEGYGDDDSEGFQVWGFVFGLLLGPLAYLISLIFIKDRNFRTWVKWGSLLWLIVFGLARILAA